VRKLARLVDAARGRFRALWTGDTRPAPLELFRIGLAVIILVRTTDVFRPWVFFDHYAWTKGVEFSPEVDAALSPRLLSPLFPLPTIPDAAVRVLVDARTWLAVFLLFGLRTRWTALALFLVGYGLVALDRYRYFHHTHLLWTSCLWLSVANAPGRWSVERLWSRSVVRQTPRWPLQLLRGQCLIVYAAAGVAKLNTAWLSGRGLEQIVRAGLIGGPLWGFGAKLVGLRGAAMTVAAAELGIVVLLSVPRLRLGGVALGLALHAALGRSLVVSTFGAQMALYLMLFLPWDFPRAGASRRRSQSGAP
jgi:Vitamin K-dependent gamma-carboxylase